DGTSGTDTYNEDGSSSGTTYQADTSYTTYTDDGHGHVLTTRYTADGHLIAPENNKTTYADGSYRLRDVDASGNTTFTLYDSHGTKIADSWTKIDGTRGTDIFGADGSTTGTTYYRDGSYVKTENDGQGQIITHSFAFADSSEISTDYRHEDGL